MLFFFYAPPHSYAGKGESAMKKMGYQTGGRAGKRVACSLAVSIGILMIGAVVVTSLVCAGMMGEEVIENVTTGLLFAATLMGAVVASAGRESFWVPLAASVAMEYLLLIGLNVAAYDGGLQRIWIGSLVMAVCNGYGSEAWRWR